MRRPQRKKRKTRSKSVRLSRELWLRNAKDIKSYRETELFHQDYICAISCIPLDETNCVLDHAHMNSPSDQGRVRGVLQGEINLLEGRYLKLFNKAKLEEKYGLTFPELLINMGTYLQQDYSKNPFHPAFMSEYRNYIKRLTKGEIVSKLKSEFKLTVELKVTHRDLVQIYMQEWVDRLEKKFK